MIHNSTTAPRISTNTSPVSYTPQSVSNPHQHDRPRLHGNAFPTAIRLRTRRSRPVRSHAIISAFPLSADKSVFRFLALPARRTESMQLSGVRLSVCPIRPPHNADTGLLLWARRAVDIDRLLQRRRENASSATLSEYV